MTPDDLLRFDRRVPRYTSYPTAADFTAAIDAARYREWLGAVPRDEELSLYVHIPFCSSLCWFCGCHTTIVRRYHPIAAYLKLLGREIEMLAVALGGRRRVVHLHWGGGTPTMLRPAEIHRLAAHFRTRFRLTAGTEFAVEVDPRTVGPKTVAALAEAGVTRVSLGVQDFDAQVQRAINRIQSFELTKRVVDWLRAAGIDALNIDLLYGLPGRTAAGLVETVDKTLALNPGRIAVYGYAHVPWMKRHQKLIDERLLPDAVERVRQATAAAARLVERGYLAIGLDHFATPSDPIALAARAGRLRRNFQGYTTDPSTVLIGLGASAIGTLPQGYAQNAAEIPAYRAAIDGGGFATVRGVEVSDDDNLRRAIIERLMCDLEVDLDAVCRARGRVAADFAREIEALAPLRAGGAVHVAGNHVRVAADARLLVRVVCAAFDRHLPITGERHARAV